MTNIGIEELKRLGSVVSAMIVEYFFYSPNYSMRQVNVNMLHNQTQMAEAEYAFSNPDLLQVWRNSKHKKLFFH
jgi:hypothetical protein